jgi:TrwC relaxase
MSLHKLTAGSGYDYLTRQVAALDSTDKGHTGLASYYTERGESPGVWVGSGMAGIDGLDVGDPVTAEQMRALFGCGLHPLAGLRLQQIEDPNLTGQDFQEVMRLGAPFKIIDEATPFRVEVAQRIAALNATIGEPVDASVAAADRARIRTQVAREFFVAEHGRAPIDAAELAGQIAKSSRPRAQTVAGFDLTFSPVKSVSTLWAVADPAVAAVIEQAHQAAVKDALAFIEKHALFTRTGPQGIRQVDVRGLVATAFTHRDSRAGDPDLHTHVAVANKVQTLDGRWLSIDGRVLFKANVAASETYNTALEQHLRGTLGVRFAERPGTDPTKRPIREIVCRPPTEPALVHPPRPHQHPPRRAGDPFPERSWPATDAGRSAASGATGDIGDPGRQARTPISGRATLHQAERSRSRARRTRRRRIDGADGVGAARRDHYDRRRRLGRTDSRAHPERYGGEPVDLADVACPGRSTTTGPPRERARRAGKCLGGPAGR